MADDLNTLFRRMSGKRGDDPGKGLDNNFAQLLQQMKGGGQAGGMPTVLRDLLGNFEGSEDHLRGQMQTMAPFLASMLYQSKGYKALSDFNQFDPMAAYGAGAGKIGSGVQQATQQGQQQLARAGLGRSAAMGAVARQATQAGAGQQANLFSQLYQQSQATRAAQARQLFDMDRSISGLALGSIPNPRIKQKSGLGAAIAGFAGNALGMLGGGLLAGHLGRRSRQQQQRTGPYMGQGT